MRRVRRAGWTDLGDGVLRFEIEATAFCHQMVRSIVGTLVAAGHGRGAGRRHPRDPPRRDRARAAAPIAPPHGLCLWHVATDVLTSELRHGACAAVASSFASGASAPDLTLQSPRTLRVRTYSPKASEITRKWYVVDAEDLVLGRLSTEVARILRGKHKPTFAPHLDTGDHVIVVNAEKVVLTAEQGRAEAGLPPLRLPGRPQDPHLRARPTPRKPEEAVRRAIRGMLPKNRLGRQMLTKLKVYAGPNHPHAAQMPEPLDLAAARRTA